MRSGRLWLTRARRYDPTPSILNYSLASIESLESQTQPPTKRTKLSTPPIPDTITGRLEAGTYSSFNVFLADVSAICKALNNSATPKSITGSSWENANSSIARVIHFECLSKDLVNRQRKRQADVLDLTDELDASEQSSKAPTSDKVALTVLTCAGAVFSSLPKPDNITIPSTVSSRSTSATGSPKSPASTAATSMSDWPKHKVERLSVVTPFAEPALAVSHISTVKAVPGSENARNKTTTKAPKLGEVFPPPPVLQHYQYPPVDYRMNGILWGGGVGPGGFVTRPELDRHTEVRSHWLQYTNFAPPHPKRLPPDPFKQGIGLPANFVAAYSSFAPTRDESLAKVPVELSNAVWWENRGGRIFRRMFKDDPAIGHMYKSYTPIDLVERPANPVAQQPSKDDVDEKEIEKLIENFEELPIDTRLLMSNDAVLTEISSLLSTLQSQQYCRLSAIVSPNENPAQPASEEVKTYIQLRDRLSSLIESLPPHLLATIDGHAASELMLSSKIPISEGKPVFKGTLPNEDVKQIPQVQQAAMTAMNAAAGLSPVHPAPVASMLGRHPQQQQSPHLMGTPNVSLLQPQQRAHHHQQPQTPQPHHYASPAPGYNIPTPQQQQGYHHHQYPQQQQQQRQYAPGQPHTPQPQVTYAQRPRGNVPPPQGLGAIGVGGGGYGYSPRTPQAVGNGQERYTRSRR